MCHSGNNGENIHKFEAIGGEQALSCIRQIGVWYNSTVYY